MLCKYQQITKKIHCFKLLDNSAQGVADYVKLWEEKVPSSWRSNEFDGVLRVLVDMRESGTFAATQLYEQVRHVMPHHDDIPPARVAYVITPSPHFIPQMRVFDNLLNQREGMSRRFFNADEFETAVQWLIEGE